MSVTVILRPGDKSCCPRCFMPTVVPGAIPMDYDGLCSECRAFDRSHGGRPGNPRRTTNLKLEDEP